MSDKKFFSLVHTLARRNAAHACMTAPDGWSVTIQPRTRSLDQNAMLWSQLSELSKQLTWPVDGQSVKLSPEDWKHVVSAGLKRHQRVAMGIDGGFVVLGQSTSKMTVAEMSELIELIYAFGAARGVKFHDEVAA